MKLILTLICFTIPLFSQGRFKPSQNNSDEYLRALVIFVQFSNDNSDVINWPSGKLPNYANNIFDNKVGKKYRDSTVSDYFSKMSNGKFDFIADVYPDLVRVEKDSTYGECNLQVLHKIDNEIKDFKKYDNWKNENGKFIFKEGNGDGYVDMLFIIYRNTDNKKFGVAGGMANLGFSKDFLTHDKLKINGSGPGIQGSGVTSIVRNKMYNAFMITPHLSHEYGHYLFGSGHTRISGLMTGEPYGYWGGTLAMSSWEKNFLGYNNFIDANSDGYTKDLRDFVKTGEAIRVSIPINNSNSGEYFLIENHQRISMYDRVIMGGALAGDWRPNYTIGKGIYIWYVTNGNNFPPNIVSIQADGSWDWQPAEKIVMPEGWPPTLTDIKKVQPDIYLNTGKGDRNADLLGVGAQDKWHNINPLTKKVELTREVMGNETDAFNINYNNQITPWSNPSTTKLEGKKEVLTNIAIELVEQNGNNIKVKVYGKYESCLALPPSKPQSLSVELKNNHPSLTWISNKEPDLMKYKVYRAETNGEEPKDFKSVGEINSSSNPKMNWIDEKINIKNGNGKMFYKISAVDKTSKESQLSDYDWIAY
ncbi:MAG TPA: hypothetical protein VFF33_03875 [Ignavibacteriaceae bacterium]|nr:hypothetical protein [Ignavibacteriaceae bacterium]